MQSKDILYAYINMRKDELIAHTIRVVDMCKRFATNLGWSDERANFLLDSAWLHDIAKFDDEEEHNTKKRVKKAITGVIKDAPINNAIYDIIEAHKDDFGPDEQYQLEAAILRICDKLDKFNKGKEDALKSCEKSIKKIKKQIPELPEEFMKVYSELLDELKN